MKDFNFQLFGVLRRSTLRFNGSPLLFLMFYSNLSGRGVYSLFTDAVCKIGDGIGGSEIIISRNRTINQCYKRVKQLYPNANGITMGNPCLNGCACFAEFNMTGWSGTSHQSCMFLKGNFSV